MGMPGYVAPEVLAGASRSAHSDLYSLAVAAYRLLVRPLHPRRSHPEATVPCPTAGPLHVAARGGAAGCSARPRRGGPDRPFR
jgi:hypothetical protein